MKKFIAIMAVAALFLAGCSKDDETKKEEDPVSTDVTYEYNASEDLLAAMDVNVTYTKADGTTASEKVTTTKWTKTVKNVTLPFTQKITATYAAKSSFTASKAEYTFSTSCYLSYSKSNGDSNKTSGMLVSSTVLKDNVARYLAIAFGKPNDYSQVIK